MDQPTPAAMTSQSRRNLAATLGFLQIEPRAPELLVLHRWPTTWRCVGILTNGLHRTGYDLHVSQYGDDTWRATVGPEMGLLRRDGEKSRRGPYTHPRSHCAIRRLQTMSIFAQRGRGAQAMRS